MFKTALTTALVLGTASVALATEFDANPANRYPAFAAPVATQAFQSAPAALLQGRNVALTGNQVVSGAKAYDREGASHDGGTSR
jgi:hypothetical protein